jgi:5-methylcytosine-specific restriction endonuclease McrA
VKRSRLTSDPAKVAAFQQRGRGPAREVREMGTRASVAKRQQTAREQAIAAGVDPDGPRNRWGQLCVAKRCEVCSAPFLAYWRSADNRKTCSRACGSVYRRDGGTDRVGEANPNYRNGKRAGVRDRAGERRWYAALGTSCTACGSRDRLALHHCVYRQHVRAVDGDVWDPRNALTLCPSCHAYHHGRGRVLALPVLPDSVFEFAAEVLGARAYGYLRRRYAGDDARLDLLLLIEAA